MRINALWFVILALSGSSTLASEIDFRQSSQISPSQYLLRSQDQHQDAVFDQYKTIELGASVGVGSDCGKIDFKNTLQASLKNVLDAKYFESLGTSILASSPMLLTCYFSPTWCAILKHSQLNAHWLSQMRLDQCSIVDKYVDHRVEDFYEERQSCVRKAIESNGGDLEHAMESCRGGSVWNQDLANWAGSRNGEKSASNRLIGSSAQWAGLDTPEAKGSLDLVKALVGDTVISKGSVSVEYGPRQSALSARTYLQSIEKTTYGKLCQDLMRRLDDAGPRASIDRVIQETDLKALSPSYNDALIDKQTLRSLQSMPFRARGAACKSLSDALALTLFSNDVNRSLDIMTTLSQNPNLPPHRKQELEDKRKALKDSVEMAVSLQKERNGPLNQALSQINSEGRRIQDERVRSELATDSSVEGSRSFRSNLMNCADGFLCEEK